MFYTKEKTKEILFHHISRIASNWTTDDYIMWHFTSGDPVLIDFRDHKLANDFCRVGFCRATVEELQSIVNFEKEIPNVVLEAMNNALSQKIHSDLVFDRFVEGHKLYVKLSLTPEEAKKRFQKWQDYYKKSRRSFW